MKTGTLSLFSSLEVAHTMLFCFFVILRNAPADEAILATLVPSPHRHHPQPPWLWLPHPSDCPSLPVISLLLPYRHLKPAVTGNCLMMSATQQLISHRFRYLKSCLTKFFKSHMQSLASVFPVCASGSPSVSRLTSVYTAAGNFFSLIGNLCCQSAVPSLYNFRAAKPDASLFLSPLRW